MELETSIMATDACRHDRGQRFWVPSSAFPDMLWENKLFCSVPLCRLYAFVFLHSNIITIHSHNIIVSQTTHLDLELTSKPNRPTPYEGGVVALFVLLYSVVYSQKSNDI